MLALDQLTLFGLFAVSAMLVCYAFEDRSTWFVFGFAVLELVLGVTQTAAGVAHFAHLGGMLGGWLMIQYRRGGFPFQRR